MAKAQQAVEKEDPRPLARELLEMIKKTPPGISKWHHGEVVEFKKWHAKATRYY